MGGKADAQQTSRMGEGPIIWPELWCRPSRPHDSLALASRAHPVSDSPACPRAAPAGRMCLTGLRLARRPAWSGRGPRRAAVLAGDVPREFE
jgi:hypothetical protein